MQNNTTKSELHECVVWSEREFEERTCKNNDMHERSDAHISRHISWVGNYFFRVQQQQKKAQCQENAIQRWSEVAVQRISACGCSSTGCSNAERIVQLFCSPLLWWIFQCQWEGRNSELGVADDCVSLSLHCVRTFFNAISFEWQPQRRSKECLQSINLSVCNFQQKIRPGAIRDNFFLLFKFSRLIRRVAALITFSSSFYFTAFVNEITQLFRPIKTGKKETVGATVFLRITNTYVCAWRNSSLSYQDQGHVHLLIFSGEKYLLPVRLSEGVRKT